MNTSWGKQTPDESYEYGYQAGYRDKRVRAPYRGNDRSYYTKEKYSKKYDMFFLGYKDGWYDRCEEILNG